MADITISWQGNELPPDKDAAESQILRELDELMGETVMENLFFHTVFLGKTMDDASVFVTPSREDPTTVECWYSEKTVWTSISDMDDESVEMARQMRDAMRDGPLPDSQPLVVGEDEI